MVKDVFLCHATKDKEQFVRPFAEALAKRGISYWLDEAEIGWGDRVSAKMDEGLRNSRFVILFLGRNFLEREWPEDEMRAVLQREKHEARKILLPLILDSERKVCEAYPLIADRMHLKWEQGLDEIVSQLGRELGHLPSEGEHRQGSTGAPRQFGLRLGEGRSAQIPIGGEDSAEAAHELPDYLMDLERLTARIAELEERAKALASVDEAEAANALRAEAQELRRLQPVVERGYPLVESVLLEITLDAVGFPVYLLTDMSDVPTSTLHDWHKAKEAGIFEDFLLWGFGDETEEYETGERVLMNVGGYIVGVANDREFWVAEW